MGFNFFIFLGYVLILYFSGNREVLGGELEVYCKKMK